jgi:Xaa-Pro aminopeptidase
MAKRRAPARPKNNATEIARARLAALRAACRKLGVSHAVITDPMDVGYLTGFLGGDSVLIAGPGKPTIVSDGRYLEELGAFKPVAKIVMRDGSMSTAVAGVLADLHDAGRLDGFVVQGEHMTLGEEQALRGACKSRRVPVKSMTSATGLVLRLRTRKDAGEIRAIRAAIAIQEEALIAALEYLRPGMSELEFCAELEYQMKTRGAGGPAFGTIIAAGANGSLPHYRPADARIKGNATLLIDWGAELAGYRGDMTRTFALGRWPRQMREIYGIVLEAHERAAAALKPGADCAAIDAIARKVIADAGYAEYFSHGLGHGLGLNVHESPRFSRFSEGTVLEEGHVVTIEPGIYLPGIGGVRIEDDYAITARGRKNLCTLPRDIDWATI